MSLDSEGDLSANRVPGVEISNGLIDAIFIFGTHQTVVLKVVSNFLPEDTKDGVYELEFKSTNPKEVKHRKDDHAVDNEVLYHLVFSKDL